MARSYAAFILTSLILLGSVPDSFQWINLGAAVSSIANVVNFVPNTISSVHNSIESLFANSNPDDIIFEFSPSPGIIQKIDIHDPESVSKTDYNMSRPTVIITHGFTPVFKILSGSNTVFGTIADAYFEIEAELNLIAVNWEDLARPRGIFKPLHYGAIVHNVPIVAKRVAEFVIYLMQNAELDLDNLHLIGFSLGAHVSGLAGDNVRNMTGQQVHRITGLDPAAPQFYVPTTHISQRLDDTDARFVATVHTNVKANGIWYPIGHVDFYPNDGGPIQPACSAASTLFGISFIYRLVCSHSQAYHYYAESILGRYEACPCDSVSDLATCEKAWDAIQGKCENAIPFGDKCPETERGIYFLKIDSVPGSGK